MKTQANDKAASYASYKRSHTWIENSLAHSDEDEGMNFDWKLVRMFFPYIGKYKTPAIWSMVLMLVYTVLNLLNPWLIGLAIDNYIIHSDLVGLAILSIIFLVVNVAMWQAQYWQVWSMSWAGQQILF